MRFTIEVSVPARTWSKALPRVTTVARRAAAAALEHGWKKAPTRRLLQRKAGRGGACEVSLALATDATVRRLNHAYRGKDKATNVLSFPADAPAVPGVATPLGDVIVAYGVATAESRAERKTLTAHLTHLVVHGVLHLLGYDHVGDDDVIVMERMETAIMARLGFADPYAGAAPAPVRPHPVRPRSAHPRPVQPAPVRSAKTPRPRAKGRP
jgi:probable rRNA maturation factor